MNFGPEGVRRIGELEKWLDGTELRVGHTYLPGDLWSNIEGKPGFLADWATWRRAADDRMFVLNVPMLERNEDHVPDEVVRARLRAGAAGAYDAHFTALAKRLVDLKVPDTVIVLGWEMNGNTYTHRCGPDPGAWKKYWSRIVTAMRAVPGQKFKFDFAPTRGRDAIPWTDCYPGDDSVDIIGMDSYDQPENMPFDKQISEPYGLQQQVDFAKAHGKEISYPEWGLFASGDNPGYMRHMLNWIDEHKPLYSTISDYCPHGVWQCTKNPRSSVVYRSVLSGRKEPGGVKDPSATPSPAPFPSATPPAAPAASPHPVTTGPPKGCVPVELGDWAEYWLGGKLCVRLDWWREK
ncbi:glycoside hydrolase family 26 protein [Streptomyces tsukubensis]|uniref:glycoside hydrolase family 26 protein n=1 Tax=Streptomyces tsukubensis TaxID=83656 RepID=UPI00386AA8B0